MCLARRVLLPIVLLARVILARLSLSESGPRTADAHDAMGVIAPGGDAASLGCGELLASAFDIKTVRDLGRNKFFRAATALVDLEHSAG
jgi:hypothetical protein